MENFKEFHGKDLQDALQRAATELDRPKSEIDYEVVEEGRKGWFLGMGGRSFTIRVRMARPASYETPPEDGHVELIESIVADLMRGMHMDVSHRVRQEGDSLRVEISGADREYLIDPEGETLNALQFLLTRMSRGNLPEGMRIVVDSDGFRKRREEDLVRLAREAADRVVKEGEPERLAPMNPYERRLVHTALRDRNDVVTRSTGDGFLKRVSIMPPRRPGSGPARGPHPGGRSRRY